MAYTRAVELGAIFQDNPDARRGALRRAQEQGESFQAFMAAARIGGRGLASLLWGEDQAERGPPEQGHPDLEKSEVKEQHGASAQEGAGPAEQQRREQHDEEQGGGERRQREQKQAGADGGEEKGVSSSAEGCEKVCESDMPAQPGGDGQSQHLSKVGENWSIDLCVCSTMLCFAGMPALYTQCSTHWALCYSKHLGIGSPSG